jgi:predicted transcriptional regulator
MTAPAYSLVRSAVAKRLGLGGRFTSPKAQPTAKGKAQKATPRRRPRARPKT